LPPVAPGHIISLVMAKETPEQLDTPAMRQYRQFKHCARFSVWRRRRAGRRAAESVSPASHK